MQPPSKAKRQSPAVSRYFLYRDSKGIKHSGIRPIKIIPQGREIFEPK
jgi:hypothetical protein